MKIVHILGARPNFMKVAAVHHALKEDKSRIQQILIHTGQHYDHNMSQVFFDQLKLPAPDHYLGVGSGTHAEQTARAMLALEPIIRQSKPDITIVVGDVNSTLSGALVCSKLGVPFAHVEAGLRSFDRSMPEEVNRLLTDRIADLLFTPSPDADANLRHEGIAPERIHFVGNVMIDTLVRLLPQALERWDTQRGTIGRLNQFVLVTLHRPSNVDTPVRFRQILEQLTVISREIPVIFPVHPRTRDQIDGLDLDLTLDGLRLIQPLSYLDFLALEQHAAVVVTDSGGVQEETTYLNVPCVTVRPNTERPITISQGTNTLVEAERLARTVHLQLSSPKQRKQLPDRWDGEAAIRITEILKGS